jgi:quinol monooxygenase YgiN
VTISKGLIVRLEAKPGKEEAVANFLRSAQPLAQEEAETVAWFAFQLGPSSFAIVDVFPDEDGRNAHLNGAVAAALEEHGLELLAHPPRIEAVDALATKLP